MVIKKYLADSEQNAIMLAKEDLGSGAIVMNIKKIEPKGTEKRYYVFKVRQDANKSELMKAVEKIFNVHPLDCKIINV